MPAAGGPSVSMTKATALVVSPWHPLLTSRRRRCRPPRRHRRSASDASALSNCRRRIGAEPYEPSVDRPNLRTEYLKLLKTAFAPRQPELAKAFRAEIEKDGFLTREPFIALAQPYEMPRRSMCFPPRPGTLRLDRRAALSPSVRRLPPDS